MHRSRVMLFVALTSTALIALPLFAPPRPPGKGSWKGSTPRPKPTKTNRQTSHPYPSGVNDPFRPDPRPSETYGTEGRSAAEAKEKAERGEPLNQRETAALEDAAKNPSLSRRERARLLALILVFGYRGVPSPQDHYKRAREFHEENMPALEWSDIASGITDPSQLRAQAGRKLEEIRTAREQMRRLGGSIAQFRVSGWIPGSNASESFRKYARAAADGKNLEVSMAYADFLFACALSGAGRHQELASLRVESRPTQDGEVTQLRELTTALVRDARLRNATSVIPLVAQIGEAMRPISHELAAALPADTVAIATAHAGKEIAQLEALPEWQRAQHLPGVSGFASTKTASELYVRQNDALFALRREKQNGRVTLLEGAEAEQAFQAHCRAQIRRYSRPGFRLANLLRVEGGYRILMKDHSVRLTNAEVALLERGERLPHEHALSRAIRRDPSFVSYSHPFMARPGRHRSEADRLAFAIQRSYPEAHVFKDDLSAETENRVRAVTGFVIDDPGKVLVLKAESSFGVTDAQIVNDIASELADAGIQVEEFAEDAKAKTGERRLVVVISGHIDEKLAEFVRRVGSAGYFQGNVIVFNSCASDLNSQLVHEMNTRYGAVATYRYEGKIPAVEIQEILMKLKDTIHQQPKLEEIWKGFVREGGLNGVWNVCSLIEEASRG